MKLGETLWKLQFAGDEKSRISRALNSEQSINYKVFVGHHRNQEVFQDICQKMVRTITGFRPTSEPYKKRVSTEVLKSLRKNKAKRDFWTLYQCSVADFVISDLSALNQLLGDTEVPEDYGVSTENILSTITESASDYSVHDKDLEALYDLWPFTRVENFGEYLARCPKYDRFRAIDEKVRTMESRLQRDLADIRVHSADEIAGLRGEVASKVAEKKELKEAVGSIRLETAKMFKSLTETVKHLDDRAAKLEKVLRRSEMRRSAERKEFVAETAKHFDSVEETIRSLRKEQNRIATELEQSLKAQPTITDSSSPASEPKASPFSLLTQSGDNKGAAQITVAAAYKKFSEICAKNSASNEHNATIYFYSALLANCLLIIDKYEFQLWQSIVGWNESSLTVCASPLWVEQDHVAEHLLWLLSEPDEPRYLAILDFDLGYMEGYLIPFLKAWRQSGRFLPWKKILLFPSGKNWSVPESAANHVALLPAAIRNASGLAHSAEETVVSASKIRTYLNEVSYHQRNIHKEKSDQSLTSDFTNSAGIECSAQCELIARVPIDKKAAEEFSAELRAFWSNRIE